VNDTPGERGTASWWHVLRRRKVVQWGLLYVAGAWGFLQGLEYVGESFNWPQQVRQIALLALAVGLPIALVLAWYHGDRGEQRIRGTELGIVALLLLLGGGIVWYYQHTMETSTDTTPAAASAPAIPTDASIAVLPFTNMSDDPADEYFSDGLAEELLNSLTRIDGLKVAARTASFQDKYRTGDVSEIARQLRVAHILEGSVRRSGARVRVTAQLIKASDGYHLWSESYDREIEDIFEVQSDIASRIAEKLRVDLVPRPTTSDSAAFDLLLRARHLIRQRNEPALLESRELLEQALDRDPNYGAAWSALAMLLNLLPTYASGNPESPLESAEKAARRAMELDPAMAEPWTVLASLNEMRGDWLEADRLYEKALALDPEDPTSQYWHAIMLSRAGYLVEAGLYLQRALALDPTNGALHRWHGMELGAQGLFEAALAEVAKGEELGSSVPFSDFVRGLIHLAQGDGAGAVENWNRCFERRGIRTQAPQLVVEALADPRGRPAALAATDDLPPDEFVFYASILLGDADRAARVVHNLERGTDVITYVMWWEVARPMRKTQDFQRFVRAVGLEELWRVRGWPDKCRPEGADDYVCE
jgi:TolB-like protein/Tfp pilus assembly protein PilF